MTHHLYWEKYFCCCCHCSPCRKNKDKDAPKEKKKNIIVRFFCGPYYKFITHKVFKWILASLSLAMIGVFIYFATTIKPNEEQVKFVSETTNFGRALDRISNSFPATAQDSLVKVQLVWGLVPQDRSSCDKQNYSCIGVQNYDNNFEMNSDEAQNALLNFCKKLKTGLSAEQISKLKIDRDDVTNDLEITCFIDQLNAFLTAEGALATYGTNPDLSLPTSEAKVKNEIMTKNTGIYDVATLSSSFTRWFEIALDFWLYSKYSYSYVAEDTWKDNGGLIGETLLDGMNYPVKSFPTIKYGRKLKFAAFTIVLDISSRTLGYPTGIPIRDEWEEFMTNEMKSMPSSLQGGLQITRSIWHWLSVQQTLSTTAMIGIGIGLGIAYPVLLIATMNFLVALYAFLTICAITASVVAMIPIAGYKLGVLESLNLVLVVGLAVDYVVHLAEGYCRSKHESREERLHQMLEEVGISVLSGACTTLGASFFLLFTTILFFFQFGLFVFTVIGFSIFYALVTFTSILAIMGPEGNFASFKACCVVISSKCKPKGSQSNDDLPETIKIGGGPKNGPPTKASTNGKVEPIALIDC